MEKSVQVYLSLGANLGNRDHNIEQALIRIEKIGRIVRLSSTYETEPVDYREQPWFLNLALELSLPLHSGSSAPEPKSLLGKLQEIESSLGRVRTIRHGPRAIDLDLLLYGDAVIGWDIRNQKPMASRALDRDALVVPHPRLHLRRFVLEPLCEIAPGLFHPVFKKPLKQMLDELTDTSVVRLHAPKSKRPRR